METVDSRLRARGLPCGRKAVAASIVVIDLPRGHAKKKSDLPRGYAKKKTSDREK